MKIRKIVKKYRSVTLRIAEITMKKIDNLAKDNDVSRQTLIESILNTAIKSNDFEIEISTNEKTEVK